MYIQRIALSVILPVRTPVKEPPQLTESVQTEVEDSQEQQQQQLQPRSRHYPLTHTKSTDTGLEEKKKEEEETAATSKASGTNKRLSKQATTGVSPTHPLRRRRSGSLNLPSSTSEAAGKKRSPIPKRRGANSVKKASSGDEGVRGVANVDGDEVRMWRGLNLDVLRSRIQRLIVLMNTSEPGTIPESSMLASLIDLVSITNTELYMYRMYNVALSTFGIKL